MFCSQTFFSIQKRLVYRQTLLKTEKVYDARFNSKKTVSWYEYNTSTNMLSSVRNNANKIQIEAKINKSYCLVDYVSKVLHKLYSSLYRLSWLTIEACWFLPTSSIQLCFSEPPCCNWHPKVCFAEKWLILAWNDEIHTSLALALSFQTYLGKI